jgi:ribosomal protein L11 methyltransferase
LASFPALDLRWGSGTDSSELEELLHALLDDYQPQAIHEHAADDGWRAFFKTPEQRDSARDALRAGLPGIEVTAVDVADEEWARRSQAELTPVRVGRIIVTPPWHATNASAIADDEHQSGATVQVIIDPSTGFGTGHHETTRLCLSLLQERDLRGLRVVDVGTGSGVLAIAAALLGAESVAAFDEDAEALRNASENVARNQVSGVVEIKEEELAAYAAPAADLVLANLTGAVITRHAHSLVRLVKPGGTLIVSGITHPEVDAVLAALGRVPEKMLTEGAWAAAAFVL